MRWRGALARGFEALGAAAGLFTALAMIVACTSVLGDDFEVVGGPAPSGGGGGGSAGGGTAGGGAASVGGSAVGGSAGGTAGAGASAGGEEPTGGGGGEPGPCTLGTGTGCGAGEKCSVVDVDTGVVDCVTAGPYLAWTACDIDTDCDVGLWCDVVDEVCRPICPVNACEGGECVDAPTTGDPVPGLRVCVANCEPDHAEPCNQVHGAVTCARRPDGWRCVKSQDGGPSTSCSDDARCSPGLLCIDYYCWEWCRIGGAGTCTTGTGSDCMAVTPAAYHDGNEYGVCGIS